MTEYVQSTTGIVGVLGKLKVYESYRPGYPFPSDGYSLQ